MSGGEQEEGERGPGAAGVGVQLGWGCSWGGGASLPCGPPAVLASLREPMGL